MWRSQEHSASLPYYDKKQLIFKIQEKQEQAVILNFVDLFLSQQNWFSELGSFALFPHPSTTPPPPTSLKHEFMVLRVVLQG